MQNHFYDDLRGSQGAFGPYRREAGRAPAGSPAAGHAAAGCAIVRDRETDAESSVCRFAEAALGAVFRVGHHDLRKAGRGVARVAQTRQAAMYLVHVGSGLTLTKVGAHFGRDRTTVAHGCRMIEERRDEPVFDQVLENLEFALRRWMEVFGEDAR
ncbi:helix-turn-helix domain-containing protein [Afifella aestuarii]|uniref:helix-turn-helix domain-containing protein n=1 Tax=Afifella aestuarii TaxID=1909496 RepID=UPI000FE30AEF|nr:helix-turn-helix domain-containing protein [Afifella aestuarii]